MLLPQHMRYTLHVTKSWDELVSLLRKLEGSEQPSTSHKSLIKTEPEQSDVNWLSNSRFGGSRNDNRPNSNRNNGPSRHSNNGRRGNNQSGRNSNRPQEKRSPRRDRNREKCSYCNKYNHSYDVCRSRLRDDEERRGKQPKDSSFNSRSNDQRSNNSRQAHSNTLNADQLFPFPDLSGLSINDVENYTVQLDIDDKPKKKALIKVPTYITLHGSTMASDALDIAALIDTGASHSFISPRALSLRHREIIERTSKNSPHYVSTTYRINSATGSYECPCLEARCYVKIGNWSGFHWFIITSRVQSQDAILGNDFLTQHAANIDYASKAVSVSGQHIACIPGDQSNVSAQPKTIAAIAAIAVPATQTPPPTDQFNSKPISNNVTAKPAPFKVALDHPVTIKPNCQQVIRIQRDSTQQSPFCTDKPVLFEPDPIVPLAHQIMFARSALRADQDIFCIALNPSHEPITLDVNTVIGTLESDIEDTASIAGPSQSALKNVSAIRTGPNLDSSQRTKVYDILARNREAFHWPNSKLGVCALVEHRIHTGDHPPVVQRQYPIPHAAREILREQVKDMLKDGSISESQSAWKSPALLIKKKLPDGSIKYRFCVDLRKVNAISQKDNYPLPRIDEMADALAGSEFFSIFDVESGDRTGRPLQHRLFHRQSPIRVQ